MIIGCMTSQPTHFGTAGARITPPDLKAATEWSLEHSFSTTTTAGGYGMAYITFIWVADDGQPGDRPQAASRAPEAGSEPVPGPLG